MSVKEEDLKVDTQFKYLDDILNSGRDNSAMIKDMVGKAVVLQMRLFLSVKK